MPPMGPMTPPEATRYLTKELYDMTNPWDSEAAFSTEHWRATQAQKAGDDSLMDSLTARMEALERDGQQFYPGSSRGISFESVNRSESLTDWTEREKEAREPVRHEQRLCGCKVGFNSVGVPVIVDPECGPMRRCRDLDWRNRHVLEQVELEHDGQPLWR